ncbi:MAG TPA: ATP-binding cassette domain-containing protein [Gaiellaceae bacterium]|nr:ATP-binding cassette domain-containing protein [Gaiellaceae bacterium]
MTSQSTSVDGSSPDGQAPALRLADVSVWRWHAASGSRVPILAGIDWTVAAGERWALLGPNGAGKTTLLTVAGAVEFPSQGTVDVLGRRLGRTDVFRLRAAIGFVDARAGHRFAPGLSVRDVVRGGATQTIAYFPDRLEPSDLDRADALLATLGLEAIGSRRFAVCSQGERKRALIARALVPRPRLLLLDEPGAGLDLPGRETLLAALTRLAAADPELAVVITTHHLEELPASTTHALLLREGRALATGAAEDVLTGDLLSTCFGLPVALARTNGRWTATAT